MKKIVTILLACLFSSPIPGTAFDRPPRAHMGRLILEGIPEIPDSLMERVVRYQNIRSAALKGWLPNGEGIFIQTRFGETQQVHLVYRPGGARHQLTFFQEPVDNMWVSPDPEVHGFLFAKDEGGSEKFQISFFDLDTGEHRLLTDGTSRHGEVRWANQGDRFVCYTTQRNGRDWDIQLMDLAHPGLSRPIVEAEGSWEPMDWSPDDRQVLVIRYVSIDEIYPYLVDLETGMIIPFNPTAGMVAYGALKFARDGRGIYFTSDQNSEFLRLRYCHLSSGQITVLTEDIPWDVGEFALSPDGRSLAFTVNQEGIDVLHILDLPSGRRLSLPDLPSGRIHGLMFHPLREELGLVLNTPQAPGDVYSLDLKSGQLVRWTHSETVGLNNQDFAIPEVIRYVTFDSLDGQPRTIPAFYYRPQGEGPFPVIIDIHGGPELQARPSFSARRQLWINELGVAILQPNVRGSSGYGKSYVELDNGFKREDSVKDIGALLDWIADRPELDSSRVAVYGSSYGGYMVLASMIHYSDRLRAGVESVGISNFVTFLESTSDYRRDLRRVEYGDERDLRMREYLLHISPTAQAAGIRKPLFISQGLNDPRVPVTESEQMVATIREQGGEVWYMLATDEGHGLGKRSNMDFFHAAVVLFLKKFLL